MISEIKEKIKLLKDYNKIAKIDKIARRYFVMNTFDGVLAILGVLLGSFIVNSEPRVVISTGIGAGVAMAVSGIWGAYLTERAERDREIKELERATLSRLRETKIGRAANAAVLVIALIDGLAPFLAAIIILAPFLLFSSALSSSQMYIISASMGFGILFMLGVFLGRMSRESILKSGLIMMLAGIVSGAVSFLLLGGNAAAARA